MNADPLLERPHIMFPRQLAYLRREFQFEQRRKYFRGRHGSEFFHQFINVRHFIRTQQSENLFLVRRERFVEQGCRWGRFRCRSCYRLQLHSYLRRQFFPHIFPGRDQLSALLYQGVRSPREFVSDISRDGKNLATLFQRATSRDACTAVLASFHDEHSNRESADDAIADGEVLRSGKRPHRELANQRSSGFNNLFRKLLVLAWINDVYAGAEDRDGFALAFEGSAVGGGIDPTGHPTNNDEAMPRKVEAQESLPAIPVP